MKNQQIADALKTHIMTSVSADVRSINVKLAQFIDKHVIENKFAQGFPGHSLTPEYLAAKQRAGYPATVGERTGALRKAATQVTNWSIWQPTLGKIAPMAIKKKRGLTAYAEIAKTRAGGELDYLRPDSGDLVAIQSKLFSLLGRNYKKMGGIRMIER